MTAKQSGKRVLIETTALCEKNIPTVYLVRYKLCSDRQLDEHDSDRVELKPIRIYYIRDTTII